jgi:glycogen phosphorylase/synthase
LTLLWENQSQESEELPVYEPIELPTVYKVSQVHEPKWKTIQVQKSMPERLCALDELSKNLWWSWNEDAIELFRSIEQQFMEGNRWQSAGLS